VTERTLRIGRLLDGEREVLEGLRTGDVLVSKPQAELREGAYVKVME
jgi:hypothetical protein